TIVLAGCKRLVRGRFRSVKRARCLTRPQREKGASLRDPKSFYSVWNCEMTRDRVRYLKERYSDRLLIALTIMLALLMFVVGPAQSTGFVEAHHFGILFGLILVAGVFIVSGSGVALVAILCALILIVVATALRLRHPSVVDIYLDAAAWL